MIPSRIIQTHRSFSNAPARDQICIQRIIELHPGWEIIFFSDGDCREFIKSSFPQYLDLYDWYPRPVMRADFFRILSVYALGGFYLDTDLWLSKALDPLLRFEAVFPWERKMSQYEFDEKIMPHLRDRLKPLQVGNYAFGAVAGHPFLASILEEMIFRTEMIESEHCTDSDILYSTGPDLVTALFYQKSYAAKGVKMLYGDVVLDVPFPEFRNEHYGQWFRFGSYGTHLMSGVWRSGNPTHINVSS